jgi:hypothetical protein
MMMLLIKTGWSIPEGVMFIPVSVCIVMVVVGNLLYELCIINKSIQDNVYVSLTSSVNISLRQ